MDCTERREAPPKVLGGASRVLMPLVCSDGKRDYLRSLTKVWIAEPSCVVTDTR